MSISSTEIPVLSSTVIPGDEDAVQLHEAYEVDPSELEIDEKKGLLGMGAFGAVYRGRLHGKPGK